MVVNLSINSYSKLLSRLYLQLASLSVSINISKIDLEATPKLGITRFIAVGFASTMNSMYFLTLFFAKSLASTSSLLFPSDKFIVAVYSLLFAVENLSFISSEFSLT